MTRAEQAKLVELLGKQLNEAHRHGKHLLFVHSWRLLHSLGAQIVDQGGEFWVVSSSPAP